MMLPPGRDDNRIRQGPKAHRGTTNGAFQKNAADADAPAANLFGSI
jgi:hypothetical protein